MSEPEDSNNSAAIPDFIDTAVASPPKPGPSTAGVQSAAEPPPTGVAPQASAAQPEKTVFGLRQDSHHTQNVVFNDDYEKRFPEDPYCQETAPNARIWRVYNEEAAAYDVVYVGQARDGLDVMLVFAGLFSAVVTSFLVQVSQSLQADYASMSAILLYDLVQLSIADGASSRLNITVPSINPSQTFRPESLTVWVNGLWVVSLAMSLVVALSAVLVKQWLHHYTSIPSGTPGARSHLRQYRFDGLQKWRVNVIIGIFPIIMHTSLALFLVGLALFFIPLRTSLACAVGVITVVLCLLYLVSSALPIFFPQCPYQTPLTDFFDHTGLSIKNASRAISGYIRRFVATCKFRIHRRFYPGVQFPSRPGVFSSTLDPREGLPASLSMLEMMAVTSNYNKLSVDALDWLFKASSNPTVHSVVVQSIGGLSPKVQAYAQLTWEGQSEFQDVRDRLVMQTVTSALYNNTSKNVEERLNRSFCFVSGGTQISAFNGTFDEPRLGASRFILLQMLRWAGPYRDELRKFFFTSYDVKLYPLVWKGVVQSVITVLSQGHFFSGQDHAQIIFLLLPVFRFRDVEFEWLGPNQDGMAVTLKVALVRHLGDISDSIQNSLMKMLSSTVDDDLPPTLPLRYQILYKAGKYALLNVADELNSQTDVEGCRHLQLLLSVLKALIAEYDTIPTSNPDFLAPIFGLLRAIIDNTPICDCGTSGWQHPLLHEMLDKSLSAILELSGKFILPRQPEFVFPSFRRLLQVPAHHLSQWKDSKSVYYTGWLMKMAFAVGNEAMYRAFIDGGWMLMFAERHSAEYQKRGYSEPFPAFVRGLDLVGPASALEYFDYCQQPRHFLIIFMMIAASWESSADVLIKLCPRNSAWWDTHHPTLCGILDWCQAPNRDDLPFPLENLLEGKVVQWHERDVSLDDTLRRFFAEDRHRRRIEWAARTIILGEAPDRPMY